MIRISIIIPVYNAAGTLVRCIDSVLAQTCPAHEIIAIDDGSTDASKIILQDYTSKHPQMRMIARANMGVSAARNAGIEAATGDWLMFLDADDYLDSATLETLEQDTCGEMALAGLTIHNAGKTYNQDIFQRDKSSAKDGVMRIEEALQNLSYYTFCGPVCKLFRTDIIKRYNILFPTDLQFGEDTIFVYTYLTYVKHLSVHTVHLYHCDKSNDTSLTATVHSAAYYGSISRIYPVMKNAYLTNHLSSRYADIIYLDALQTATHMAYEDHEISSTKRISIYQSMFANDNFSAIKSQCSPVFIALGKMHAWHLCDIYMRIRNL